MDGSNVLADANSRVKLTAKVMKNDNEISVDPAQ
jgi:hypothetical protein